MAREDWVRLIQGGGLIFGRKYAKRQIFASVSWEPENF